jgi:hypoxanthine phosphoribosyltransferase
MPDILLSADQIQKRVAELAVEISRDFAGRTPHFVVVLKGAFMFAADLLRHFGADASVDFIAVSSYAAGTTTSGEVRLLKDLDLPLNDRHVVIVEDVVDTGLTLSYLQEVLRARAPRSLATVCLLDKPARRQVQVLVDYIGFTIPDAFVVGYGLDHDERYRSLPHIARV